MSEEPISQEKSSDDEVVLQKKSNEDEVLQKKLRREEILQQRLDEKRKQCDEICAILGELRKNYAEMEERCKADVDGISGHIKRHFEKKKLNRCYGDIVDKCWEYGAVERECKELERKLSGDSEKAKDEEKKYTFDDNPLGIRLRIDR